MSIELNTQWWLRRIILLKIIQCWSTSSVSLYSCECFLKNYWEIIIENIVVANQNLIKIKYVVFNAYFNNQYWIPQRKTFQNKSEFMDDFIKRN